MGKYLNSNNREQVAIFNGIVEMLSQGIDNLKQLKKKRELDESEKLKLKYMRTARTYMDKVIEQWMIGLDAKEVKKLVDYIQSCSLLLQDNYSARIKMKQFAKDRDERIVEVPLGMLEDLLCFSAGEKCFGCQAREPEKCRLYQALDGFDMPATCEKPVACKYELPKKKKGLNDLVKEMLKNYTVEDIMNELGSISKRGDSHGVK